MEVKPGYKQTELGVIPEEWDVIDITSLCTLQRGFDITEATCKKGTVPVYSSSGISYYHNKAMVFPPGVVTGRKGLLGKVFFINEPFWPHDTTLWVKDFKGNFPAYVALVLQNFHLERLDAATSVPTLNRNSLKGHRIIYTPSLHEQRAIAAVLSDVDALIASLDALIAKKRLIKQGVMQELLTGKRRLPGFSGEWKYTKVGAVVHIINGGTPSTGVAEYWNGSIDWCTPTDITKSPGKYLYRTEKQITELGLKNSSAQILPKGTLLLCSRATIGEVKIAKRDVCTNQGIKSLVCSNQIYNEFLYYLLLTMKSKLVEKAIGLTFLEISKKDTASLDILLPPYEEQEAIGAVLSDMDSEISTLEQQLDKTRLIKQGMMQELLTGRTRIV